MNAETSATAAAPQVRDLWWQREAVRLDRRPLGGSDLPGVRGIGPALTCGLTGAVTVACIATARSCGYGTCPGPRSTP